MFWAKLKSRCHEKSSDGLLTIFVRIPSKLLAHAALAGLEMCLMVGTPRTRCEWEGNGVVGLILIEPRIGWPLIEGSGREDWKHPEDESAAVGAGTDTASGHVVDREAKMAAQSSDICSGSLSEPGHLLPLGPCWWTVPSLRCSCLVER